MTRLGMWVVVLSCALAACAWPATRPRPLAPRFRFQAGQTLTYHLTMTDEQTDASGTVETNLEGDAVLKVVKVKPDGSAQLRLLASGQARMSQGGGGEDLPAGDVPPLSLFVKPDGTITAMRDPAGQSVTRTSDMESLMTGAGLVRDFVIMTSTLFGLQLPKTLPASGKKWTGYYYTEEPVPPDAEADQDSADSDAAAADTGQLDLSTAKIQRRKVTVTFTYQGMKPYLGRTCMAFSCVEKAPMSELPLRQTIYFDAAKGQVRGVEIHVQQGDGKFDEVLQLVPPGKALAPPAPAADTGPGDEAAPQPPADPESDDDIPVVQ